MNFWSTSRKGRDGVSGQSLSAIDEATRSIISQKLGASLEPISQSFLKLCRENKISSFRLSKSVFQEAIAMKVNAWWQPAVNDGDGFVGHNRCFRGSHSLAMKPPSFCF